MRSHPWRSVCLLGGTVLVVLLTAPWLPGDEPAATFIPDAAEAGIHAALDKQLAWEFVDTPLADVAELMSDELGIEILLDVRALQDLGLDSDTPIKHKISGISTRSFLRLMLRQLDLTYRIQDSALWITTVEEAEASLITRVYPIGDLLKAIGEDYVPPSGKAAFHKEDILSTAVASIISPGSWDQVGGPGSIEPIYDSLVISQTEDVHEQIEACLRAYRQLIKADASPEGLGVQPLLVGVEQVAHLLKPLSAPLTAIIRDKPLNEVMSVLSEDFGVPIVVDTVALEDFGISPRTPLSGRFAEVPLGVALKRLLGPLDLTFTRCHEAIMVTTHEQDEATLTIGLYPVGNLVRDGRRDQSDYDFDSLTEVIVASIAPDTWEEVGGSGAIGVLLPVPTLMVSQTHEVHEQITKLLVTLEAAKKQVPEGKAVDPDKITLKAYQSVSGFVDPKAVIAIVMKDSGQETWDREDVFIEPLGPGIVVKHNAEVHARVERVLKELGVWVTPPRRGFPAGGLGGGGVQPKPDPNAQAAPQAGGGFF